jgi:hypothetical protein
LKPLPVAVFAALVVATIAAFFITQHLKTTDPLIEGMTHPAPFSNNGNGCQNRTSINFYLLQRSDSVSVFVIDSAGDNVRTIASGVEMLKPTRRHAKVRRTFYWYGRENNGQLAPGGTYHFQVALSEQGRHVDLTQYPIVIDNVPPRLSVTSVSPSRLPAPGGVPATVHFTGSNGRGGLLMIYRTDLAGPPQWVDSRRIPFSRPDRQHGYTKTWNGLIHGSPAPAGTYVMALKVTSRACVTGTFPVHLPPQAGTTPHAGVTVSYLAAEPPLDPVPAGSAAVVGVESSHHLYHWALFRVGQRKAIRGGSGTSTSLQVRLPGRSAGLYELTIRAGGSQTAVPLVARAPASNHRTLVVLPALSWQGLNQVDDNGDGFPETLTSGGPIVLNRPLANGLPPAFGGEAALLAYLDRARMPYELTTDIGLVDGSGPTLAGHSGVVFAGPEVWLPAALAPALRTYVQQGGRVLSLGAGSLQRTATVKDTPAGPQALNPSSAAATDVLGGRPGAQVSGNTHPIVVTGPDQLGIFNGTSGVFAGFGSFQPIPSVAAPAKIVSAAGTSSQTPSIVGYRLGSGTVVDIGLPAFSASLAHNVDTRELLRRLWTILAR